MWTCCSFADWMWKILPYLLSAFWAFATGCEFYNCNIVRLERDVVRFCAVLVFSVCVCNHILVRNDVLYFEHKKPTFPLQNAVWYPPATGTEESIHYLWEGALRYFILLHFYHTCLLHCNFVLCTSWQCRKCAVKNDRIFDSQVRFEHFVFSHNLVLSVFLCVAICTEKHGCKTAVFKVGSHSFDGSVCLSHA